jgi:hypothetical protein
MMGQVQHNKQKEGWQTCCSFMHFGGTFLSAIRKEFISGVSWPGQGRFRTKANVCEYTAQTGECADCLTGTAIESWNH